MSAAPTEKVFLSHSAVPLRFSSGRLPASAVEQNVAPAFEYAPAPVQFAHACSEAAPVSLYVPAGHATHSLLRSSYHVPGVQDSQLDDPKSLWPPSGHGVHVSLAPTENVFFGHRSVPLRFSSGRVPAPAVEQNVAPASEYSPAPAHLVHPCNEAAPVLLLAYDPAGHGTHASCIAASRSKYAAESNQKPAVHDSHVEEPGRE